MRILHVGNGNEKHRGQRSYDVGRKLNNGLIRNGHNVLFFSDRDTARISSLFGSSRSKKGARAANQHLIEIAEHFKPEFFLFGHADIITSETVRTMRAMFPGAKAAQFNVDAMFFDNTIRNTNRKIDVVDATFATTGGRVLERIARANHKTAFMPNPIDSSMEIYQCHQKARLEQPYDTFYAVRATSTRGDYRGNYRLELPRQLMNSVPGLRPHFHGFDGIPEIYGMNFYEAIGRCTMGLNLSQMQTTTPPIHVAEAYEKYLYSSDRITQYLGNGLLTFTQRDNKLEELYGEDAIVTFEGHGDLSEKIHYYLEHDDERQRIASNGWTKAHALFNNQLVAKYIIEATFGENFSEPYAWPTAFLGTTANASKTGNQ